MAIRFSLPWVNFHYFFQLGKHFDAQTGKKALERATNVKTASAFHMGSNKWPLFIIYLLIYSGKNGYLAWLLQAIVQMGGGDQVVAVVEESLPGRDREVAEVGQAIVQMGEGEQVVAAIVHVGADMIEETGGGSWEHWGGDSRKHSGTWAGRGVRRQGLEEVGAVQVQWIAVTVQNMGEETVGNEHPPLPSMELGEDIEIIGEAPVSSL